MWAIIEGFLDILFDRRKKVQIWDDRDLFKLDPIPPGWIVTLPPDWHMRKFDLIKTWNAESLARELEM